jgi:3-hydroxyisobutyrate dehydrogenase-like beta-hydroxyacid dehydrogenase
MNAQTDKRIGLIGIGLVGTALAENLIAGGYDVAGFDIDPEKCRRLVRMGGTAAGGPRQAAEGRRAVILSLMTSQIVREVVTAPGGVLEAQPPPRFVIDTTTGDPDMTVRLAAELAGRGIACLDATISGSSAEIRRREGVLMIGGDRAAVEACRDIFEAVATKFLHVGPPGDGARCKLAVNLVLGLNRVALAEGLIFGEAIGLEPQRLFNVLNETYAYSRVMDIKGPKMLQGDFRPGGRLAQHKKDVDTILAYAERLGLDLPLSRAHREVLAAAIAIAAGELDNAAVIRELRRRAQGKA